jgi:hypothetical protein
VGVSFLNQYYFVSVIEFGALIVLLIMGDILGKTYTSSKNAVNAAVRRGEDYRR